jgi:hypothetical protein
MNKPLQATLPPAKAASSKKPTPQDPLDGANAAAFLTMRRAAIMLKGEFSARDLFIYHEQAAIDAEVEREKSTGNKNAGGALLNHVVKNLFTAEKQQEYASKVPLTPVDIAQYVAAHVSPNDIYSHILQKSGPLCPAYEQSGSQYHGAWLAWHCCSQDVICRAQRDGRTRCSHVGLPQTYC